jgi:acetyltransferase
MMESVRKTRPEARIDGILVSQMQKKRYELLIGANKDPIFGPVIVFGMGGVTVELFRDLHIALPPLNMALAGHLMEGTKVARLLEGYRGMPAADIEYVKQLLCRFASLVIDLPEVKEIDINPFAIDETGAYVLDAKVVIDRSVIEQPQAPHEHLVIAPYPKQFITEWQMEDGQPVLLRPIRPEDEPLEAEMFKQLSDPTEYFRFFKVFKQVSMEEIVRFTHTDYDRELAIIAEVEEDGEKKMAGVARLIGDAYNENAEFAIIVADPWQRKGLGTKLIEYSLQIAASRGIPIVYATILKENTGIIRIFQRMGFEIREDMDYGTYTAMINLTDPQVKKRFLTEEIEELQQA